MSSNEKQKFSLNDELNDDFIEDEEFSEAIISSYACEDCDYRWEVTFDDEEHEARDEPQFCPMCGSQNSTQI